MTPAADLSEEERGAVCRTVARIIESRAGEDDLPFALAENRVGIIFPEVGAPAAWDAVGHVLEACIDRRVHLRQPACAWSWLELAELDVGISQFGPRARHLADPSSTPPARRSRGPAKARGGGARRGARVPA